MLHSHNSHHNEMLLTPFFSYNVPIASSNLKPEIYFLQYLTYLEKLACLEQRFDFAT